MVKINLANYRAFDKKRKYIILSLILLLGCIIEYIVLYHYRLNILADNQLLSAKLQVKPKNTQTSLPCVTNVCYIKHLMNDLSAILSPGSLDEIKMSKKQICLVGYIDSAQEVSRIIQEIQEKKYVLQVSQDYLKLDNQQKLKYKLNIKFI